MSDIGDTTNTVELPIEPKPENPPNKIIATQNGRQWIVEIEGILGIRDVKSLKRSIYVAVNRQRRSNSIRRFNARGIRAKELSNDQ